MRTLAIVLFTIAWCLGPGALWGRCGMGNDQTFPSQHEEEDVKPDTAIHKASRAVITVWSKL